MHLHYSIGKAKGKDLEACRSSCCRTQISGVAYYNKPSHGVALPIIQAGHILQPYKHPGAGGESGGLL